MSFTAVIECLMPGALHHCSPSTLIPHDGNHMQHSNYAHPPSGGWWNFDLSYALQRKPAPVPTLVGEFLKAVDNPDRVVEAILNDRVNVIVASCLFATPMFRYYRMLKNKWYMCAASFVTSITIRPCACEFVFFVHPVDFGPALRCLNALTLPTDGIRQIKLLTVDVLDRPMICYDKECLRKF